MKIERFYIGGKWQAPFSHDAMDVINPATGRPAGSVALGNHQDVDAAVAAGRAAAAEWGTASPQARKAVMQRIVDVYARRRDELADAMTLEMGAPRTLARGAQAGAGLGHLKDFVRAIDQVHWEKPIFPDDASSRIVMEPKGVAALITPWNWPMNRIALKVGAALAAGCTMVLKPSEYAPFSATIFAEVLDEAGVPAGVFNLVHGTGSIVGERLAQHPDIAVISLTGSTRAGVAVARQLRIRSSASVWNSAARVQT